VKQLLAILCKNKVKITLFRNTEEIWYLAAAAAGWQYFPTTFEAHLETLQVWRKRTAPQPCFSPIF